MTTASFITGGDGLRLNLVSTGPEDARPILFVHGFLHSTVAWARQFGSRLANEFRLHGLDMRGHGASDKPRDLDAYRNGALWAVDMAAAIDACARPPVVVVWSYPGLMLGDYLRRFGDAAIAGVVLVAALTGIGLRRPPTRQDSPSPLFAEDPDTARPALRAFISRCVAGGLPEGTLAALTEGAAAMPREARLGPNMRRDDFLPDYARLTRPALVVFGEDDDIVDRSEAENAARAIPGARLALYEDTGHMPFYEAPGRFNDDLAAFVRATREAAA